MRASPRSASGIIITRRAADENINAGEERPSDGTGVYHQREARDEASSWSVKVSLRRRQRRRGPELVMGGRRWILRPSKTDEWEVKIY